MDGYLGQVMLFATSNAPRNWVHCEGQVLNIAENQQLFSLLGTQFGGDGRETFALPTIPPVTEGVRYVICVKGAYVLN